MEKKRTDDTILSEYKHGILIIQGMNASKQKSPPSSSICTNVWHNLEGGRTARRSVQTAGRRPPRGYRVVEEES